jgi:hypothetical protein
MSCGSVAARSPSLSGLPVTSATMNWFAVYDYDLLAWIVPVP